MIRINLLGDDTAIDSSSKLIVAGFVASLIALCAVCFFMQSSFTSQIEALELDIGEKEQELARLEKVTKEVKDLEAKESEYNNKIAVIANLKKSKLGPVRILDDLNLSVPEHAWVMSLKEEAGLMRIDGKAIDNQTIAGFMRELEQSDYVKSVDLGETRQSDERGAKIKAFSLSAVVQYAGGAKASTLATTEQVEKK
jgi:type IV pilus assembly protein PilN